MLTSLFLCVYPVEYAAGNSLGLYRAPARAEKLFFSVFLVKVFDPFFKVGDVFVEIVFRLHILEKFAGRIFAPHLLDILQAFGLLAVEVVQEPLTVDPDHFNRVFGDFVEEFLRDVRAFLDGNRGHGVRLVDERDGLDRKLRRCRIVSRHEIPQPFVVADFPIIDHRRIEGFGKGPEEFGGHIVPGLRIQAMVRNELAQFQGPFRKVLFGLGARNDWKDGAEADDYSFHMDLFKLS